MVRLRLPLFRHYLKIICPTGKGLNLSVVPGLDFMVLLPGCLTGLGITTKIEELQYGWENLLPHLLQHLLVVPRRVGHQVLE